MNENVDFIARCIAGSAQEIARKAISDLGGMQILKISREDYDSIEHDPNTIYYVTDGDTITQYIGDSTINSNMVNAIAIVDTKSLFTNSITGNAREE